MDSCLMNWSDVCKYRFFFKNIVSSDLKEIIHIHPLKQDIVNTLYQSLSKLAEIDMVYIFGSATDIRCTS